MPGQNVTILKFVDLANVTYDLLFFLLIIGEGSTRV
jgi:hypothetical protein